MNLTTSGKGVFDDLMEDLSAPGAGQGSGGLGTFAEKQASTGAVVIGHVAFERKPFEEKCPKCKGSGQFIGWSGRNLGSCHKCKGKGVLYFAQPAEQRVKQREQVANRKARVEQERIDALAAEHPREYTYLVEASERGFEIAVDMLGRVRKFGSLSDKSLQAVRRFIWQDAERANAKAKREAAAPVIDASRIKLALDTAKGNGLRNPKLRLAAFVFSLAKDASPNAGCVYVVGSGDTYLGKIKDGRFMASRDGQPHEAEVLKVAADPAAAADAYGQETGCCACCGRELTAEESVKRAIGPICARKFGF